MATSVPQEAAEGASVSPEAAALAVEARTAPLPMPGPWTPGRPWSSAAVGAMVGLGSGLGVRATYPPARHMTWVPATIFIGSTLAVGAAFLVLVYHGRRRSADWLAAAYIAAVVLLAVLDVGFEVLGVLVVKAPGLLGVAMIPRAAPMLPAPLVSTLAGACALLAGASYGLWCLEALPRLRVVLAVIGLLCLAVAAGRHGYWLAGGPPAPVVPQVQQ